MVVVPWRGCTSYISSLVPSSLSPLTSQHWLVLFGIREVEISLSISAQICVYLMFLGSLKLLSFEQVLFVWGINGIANNEHNDSEGLSADIVDFETVLPIMTL